MNWNHRVWTNSSKEETSYSIKETYYNESGEICGCTDEPANMFGYTLDEFKENIERMQRALQAAMAGIQPILDEDVFVFAEW